MNYREFMDVIDAYGRAERELGKKLTKDNADSVVEAWKKVCELAVKYSKPY